MLTLTQFARLRKLSRTRVWALIQQGRIPGAQKHGGKGNAGIWLIPSNAKVKTK